MKVSHESGRRSGSVRAANKSSADPRAERTRAALRSALVALDDAGEPVTVSTLTRRAGVSRSVFYRHFSSIEAPAASVLAEVFDQIGQRDRSLRAGENASGAVVARDSLSRVVAHVSQQRALYASIFATDAGAQAHAAVLADFTAEVWASLNVFDAPPPGVDPQLAGVFVSAGIIAVLTAWIRGELDQEPEELIDRLMRLIPDWMASPHPSAPTARNPEYPTGGEK